MLTSPSSDSPAAHAATKYSLVGTHGVFEPPSPVRRISALILDTVILAIPLGVLTVVCGMNFLYDWGLVVSTVVFWLTLSLMQATWQKTPGKAALGLVVQADTGRKLVPGLTLLRNAWVLAGLLPVIGEAVELLLALIIVASMFVGDRSRGLHDHIADAQVLRERTTS